MPLATILPHRRALRQRGAAVVTAMLVTMLAVAVISVLYAQQNVIVRTVENHLALSQTHWIERAALDWAKVILRADARSGTVDYIGEPWSLPVADTQLDETITGGAKLTDDARSAMLAGQIVDALSRMNLNSLAVNGAVVPAQLLALRRLMVFTGLPEGLADLAAVRVLQSSPRNVDGVMVPATVPPLVKLSDLLQVQGFDQATLDALSQFVIVLPRPTPVNVNTAPAEVLGAYVPGIGLSGAQRFVAQRARTYYRDVTEAGAAMGAREALSPDTFSVGSNFFLVRGMVRYGRVESYSETLLERNAERVDIIWQQRI